MDIKEAIDIMSQVVDNTQTTVKDAKLILEAWETIKTTIDGTT